MKITRNQLRQIIKEEISGLNEGKNEFSEQDEIEQILRPLIEERLGDFTEEDRIESGTTRGTHGSSKTWAVISKKHRGYTHFVKLEIDTLPTGKIE